MLSTSSHGQEGSQQLSLVQQSPTVVGGNDGKKSKPRTSITPKQLEVLTVAYNEDQHPSKQVREELVTTTGLEMKVHTNALPFLVHFMTFFALTFLRTCKYST